MQVTNAKPLPGSMSTRGNYGWYLDHEGVEYRRASTLLKQVETDTYNLDQWKLRQVAEGLALRDDLVLSVKAMGRPDPVSGWTQADKSKLNGIVRDAMGAAKQSDGARKGTALHDLTERLDRGENIESVCRGLPAGPSTILRAYDFMRRSNGWTNVEIERTVVNDELQVAGTFDRVETIAGLTALMGGSWVCQHGHTHGEESNVIADVKSEAEPWRNGLHIPPQLAIYSRAKRMWLPNGASVTFERGRNDTVTVPAGDYVTAPCVRQDVAVVVHVIDGTATPYFVDLTAGWRLAQRAAAQMDDVNASKKRLGEAGAWFVEMPGIVKPKPVQMFTDHAVATQPASTTAPRLVGRDVVAGKRPAAEGELNAAGAEGTFEARRDADGMIRWHPVEVTAPPAPSTVPAGNLDEPDRQAIEVVWLAGDLDALARVYEIYTGTLGREWKGRVAEAAEARRRQIECPQRALHTGSGKCACGWVTGLSA